MTSLTDGDSGAGRDGMVSRSLHACPHLLAVERCVQAAAQGYVWQDNDQNSAYSANIDSGFEGIVVNLYRAVGSALTFLGCTNTDGTGACPLRSIWNPCDAHTLSWRHGWLAWFSFHATVSGLDTSMSARLRFRPCSGSQA